MSLRIKFFLSAFLLWSLYIAVLFFSAGTLYYPSGWLYAATTFFTTVATIVSVRGDDGLMEERSKPGPGMKSWDKKVLGLSFFAYLAVLATAGSDIGAGAPQSAEGWGAKGIGALMMMGGQWLFIRARNENRFFSSVVRIQAERGHTVCDTGPYSFVRHPGYLGMVISTAGVPLLLGSWWSVLPTLLSVGLLLIRTTLEDGTLRKELDGYEAFTERTRWRLVPHVW